jgi:TolA-binding protein
MMKPLIGIGFMALAVGLFLIVGCGEKTEQATEDVEKEVTDTTEAAKELGTEAKEAMESAAALTGEKVDEYLAEMEGQMQEIDAKIAELDEKTEMLGDEAKENFQEQIEALDEKKESIAAKMEEMKSLSGEAWEKAKQELDRLMAEFTQSYENIKKTFSGT